MSDNDTSDLRSQIFLFGFGFLWYLSNPQSFELWENPENSVFSDVTATSMNNAFKKPLKCVVNLSHR